MSCLTLIGCANSLRSETGFPNKEEIFEKNGFSYYIPENSNVIYLIGINKEAADENGLAVIPKEYNGKKIANLGYSKKVEHWSGTYYELDLSIDDSVKEVFIPSTVAYADNLKTNNGNIKYIVNCRKNSKPIGPGLSDYDKVTFVYPEQCLWMDNAYSQYKQSYINSAEKRTANVYFNLNPNNNDEYCYWLDYIQEKGTIRKPPDPQKDGFTFTGWYTEPECANKWNFNTQVELAYLKTENEIIEINNEGYRFSEKTFNEYRSYIESVENHRITFYAGWEKV